MKLRRSGWLAAAQAMRFRDDIAAFTTQGKRFALIRGRFNTASVMPETPTALSGIFP